MFTPWTHFWGWMLSCYMFHTLTNSSEWIDQINFNLGQCNLKTFAMKSCAICEFLPNGVDVAWRPFCTFCHETSSCCNSKVHCPIYSTVHMFETSVLKTSTLQYSVIVPPTGTWHLLAGWPDPPQIYARKTLIPWWCFIVKIVFMKWCYHGGAANFDVLPWNYKLL